jgi:deoxyribose-phosphate aldolase
MSGIFNRLELDVMQASELIESVELAIKYHFPAIVVHPGLASDALRTRGRAGGRFKIITPVDWPKGDNFGTLKFRGLSTDAIDTDGFEMFLTGGQNDNNTKNEAKALTEFIKRHLSELTEVRFVLGTFMRSEENLQALCRGFIGIRTPTLIRTDTQLKLQVSKANVDVHNAQLKLIRSIVRAPIKISGNISSIRAVTGCPDASRFAVSLLQARSIIKEYQQQPGELRTLLQDPPPPPAPPEQPNETAPDV